MSKPQPANFSYITKTSPNISLYFHIPFCSKKCHYCHFFVLPNDEKFKKPFVDALLKEWSLRLPQLQGKTIVSIYFGGGTPTKLAPEHYATLLDTIRSAVAIAPDCEITLEANPEDVTPSLMQQFHALGINRVSLGVQSLDDSDLILLGRTHNASRATEAIHTVHASGIHNISIDLMFELPKQTLSTWETTLRRVSTLPITHLSLYNLTFEPHTIFFKNQAQLTPQLPPEEVRLQMLETAVNLLESQGLPRYEISAFSRAGMQSRHNTGYWTGRPFLGFGPSAFSYWEGARFSNASNFKKYLTDLEQNRLPIDFEERLPYPRNLRELLAVRLRLVEGVDLMPMPMEIERSIAKVIEKGWVKKTENRIQLTPSGQLFYDSVATELI